MKAREIEAMIKTYGDVRLGDILQSFKRPYKCPKCDGRGGKQERYNAYPSGLPDSGWAVDWRYNFVECDLCVGHGALSREMKPVTETKIVGYE